MPFAQTSTPNQPPGKPCPGRMVCPQLDPLVAVRSTAVSAAQDAAALTIGTCGCACTLRAPARAMTRTAASTMPVPIQYRAYQCPALRGLRRNLSGMSNPSNRLSIRPVSSCRICSPLLISTDTHLLLYTDTHLLL